MEESFRVPVDYIKRMQKLKAPCHIHLIMEASGQLSKQSAFYK